MHNNDRISKPAQGRYFPLSALQVRSLLEAEAFDLPTYYPRLPLYMENCTVECSLGLQLASFYRRGYCATFSLPESVPPKTAILALQRAITEFRLIDKGPHLTLNDQQFVIYRAYLGGMAKLSISQHIVNAVTRSYLVYRGMSQLSKARSNPRRQVVLRHFELL